jgi:hypothetical protein
MADRFFTSVAFQRWGVLGLRILAGIALTLFGMLQIVFPSPFAGIDLRFHRQMSRRVPALYAIPGMRHRLTNGFKSERPSCSAACSWSSVSW